MSAQEIIEEFNALPPAERAQVTKYVVEHDDSWIPDEFKEAMKDAEAGRFVDMETALTKRRRRVCNEIPLPRGGKILDELLATESSAEPPHLSHRKTGLARARRNNLIYHQNTT